MGRPSHLPARQTTAPAHLNLQLPSHGISDLLYFQFSPPLWQSASCNSHSVSGMRVSHRATAPSPACLARPPDVQPRRISVCIELFGSFYYRFAADSAHERPVTVIHMPLGRGEVVKVEEGRSKVGPSSSIWLVRRKQRPISVHSPLLGVDATRFRCKDLHASCRCGLLRKQGNIRKERMYLITLN